MIHNLLLELPRGWTKGNILGTRLIYVIIVSALGPHFGLGVGLGPGLDNI